MAYRRRYRSRSAPRRKSIWVRNASAFWTTLPTQEQVVLVDLLAPIHGTSSVLRLPTFGGDVSTVGGTVVRVHGRIQAAYTSGVVTDSIYAGLQVDTWSASTETVTLTESTAADPKNWDPYYGANLGDWQAWAWVTSGMGVPFGTTGGSTGSWSFDVKAKRKLPEPNSTLMAACKATKEPSTGSYPDSVYITTSALVLLP